MKVACFASRGTVNMFAKTFLNESYSLKYPASYKTDDTADTPVNINHMTICIVFFMRHKMWKCSNFNNATKTLRDKEFFFF